MTNQPHTALNSLQLPVKKILASMLLLLVALTLLQDYLRSVVQHSAFYFSESFLFSSFWWLLMPGLYTQYLYIQYNKQPTFFTWLKMMILPATIHMMLYPALVWVLSALFYDHVFAYTQTLRFALSEYTYLLLLMYSIPMAIFHFYTNRKVIAQANSIITNPDSSPAWLQSILVSEGYTRKNIAVEAISHMTANPPYINIYIGSQKSLHAGTLRSIASQLDPCIFIRVHRSAIVNIHQVVSYTTRLNGDYDLHMKNNSTLRVSRNYAAAFKSLYQKTHPLTAK